MKSAQRIPEGAGQQGQQADPDRPGRWLTGALQRLWRAPRAGSPMSVPPPWDGTERRRGSRRRAQAAPRADADALLAVALRVLRDSRAQGSAAVEQTLCHLLAAMLQARAVYVAQSTRPGAWLEFAASAGPAASWLRDIRVSSRADLPEGRGAAGTAWRSGGAQCCAVGESRFGPWAAGARRHGIGGVLVCAARGGAGETVLLGVLHAEQAAPSQHLAEVLQQIVDELAACRPRRDDAAAPGSPRPSEPARGTHLRDPRTGLFKRRALLLRLDLLLAAPSSRAGGPALCLLELQAIAAVRARWGRDAAESVYYACAVRLREQLGDAAQVARAGRAGFALLFDRAATPRDAQRLAERALAALGQPSSCAGCAEAACCGLPVRVGLAVAEPGRDDARAAWQAACRALLRAGEAPGPAASPVD